MSFFAESSWEANTVGDKLSKEIFHKKNKRVNKQGKINKPRSVAASLKKIHRPPKNWQETFNKELTTNHAKRKAKKRQKAALEAAASGEFPPKKWERKPKPNASSIVEKTSTAAKRENFAKQKLSVKMTGDRETKSQRRRKKQKLKKIVAIPKLDSSNDEKSSSRTSEKKSSLMKNLNLQRLETMLAVKEKTTNDKCIVEPESLRQRMMSQLRASRFRFLNETLYNNESSESKRYFKEDPDAFAAYHAGYKQQVEQWPLNPLDVVISSIGKMPKDYVIADFGCGEARLAESVLQKVHSFDLVAVNDRVRACDMAHTPLLTNGTNVVVFCLSLMGTNLSDYLLEANRVLKMNGILKIADVESRFENVDEFIALLKSYGFVSTWKDLSHNLFYFIDFKKVTDVNRSTKKLPHIALKTCLYKKR